MDDEELVYWEKANGWYYTARWWDRRKSMKFVTAGTMPNDWDVEVSPQTGLFVGRDGVSIPAFVVRRLLELYDEHGRVK